MKVALEALPGSTRLNGEDGKRDPIALGDELMTVEELERWLVRWYYEEWVHQNLERLEWDVLLSTDIKGTTPAARWRHYEESGFPISLPPSRSEWLACLYEHTERRLSRTTGITVKGLHYRGDSIVPLVAKYGEDQPLRVLYNPDDFRHVFIYEGDDAPLVTLEHEFLRPETPAWTFTEAKERLKELRANSKRAPQSERFQQDLYEQIVTDSLMQKRKQPSKRERNRQTVQREKEAKAISRAATPLPPPIGNAGRNATKGAAPSITDTVPLDEVALLPVLDRSKGGQM